jgi:hypothetical protein
MGTIVLVPGLLLLVFPDIFFGPFCPPIHQTGGAVRNFRSADVDAGSDRVAFIGPGW